LKGLIRRICYEKSGVPYVVFDDVEEDPGGTTVAQGADLASKEKCDGIVVIVAGSPMYFPKVAILDPLLLKVLPYW